METITDFRDIEIKIGDKYYHGGKCPKLYEVVDIVQQFSTARQTWCATVYLARGINTLSVNSFEVSKSTILRGYIKN